MAFTVILSPASVRVWMRARWTLTTALMRPFVNALYAADRARRQLLVGCGDVTLRGEHLPGPAADVRLGRRGRDAVRHGRNTA
jgi:hypothetical protein